MIAGTMILLFGMAQPAPMTQPVQGGPLLASELVWEERAPRRRAMWTADPRLARFPEIVRALRLASIPEVRLSSEDCTETMPCYRNLQHQMSYGGDRLVTIFAELDTYLGGAHGGSAASDFVWDLAQRKRIRFGDIFTSWAAVRPLLQSRVCESLRIAREGELRECPNVDELALGLADSSEMPVGGRASAIEVRTSDYQLGSYADGRQTVWVDMDAELLGLVRPEYRGEFTLPE